MDVDWHELVLTTEWLQRIDRLAHKRFGHPGLAEEAAAYVLDKLAEDDWSVCRQYSGRSRPENYLLTVINNLLEAFSRQRFGRLRPPVWMQREGELWVRMWKMICLECQPVPAVIEHLVASLAHNRDALGNIVRVIKARLPWCGSSQREIAAEDEHKSSATDIDAVQGEPDIAAERHHLEQTLLILQQLLLTDNCPSGTDMKDSHDESSITSAQVECLQASLSLTPEERLLLKMVYQEGMKLKLVAKALGVPAYQPGRLLKGIHQRIRHAMEQSGFQLELLTEALDRA